MFSSHEYWLVMSSYQRLNKSADEEIMTSVKERCTFSLSWFECLSVIRNLF